MQVIHKEQLLLISGGTDNNSNQNADQSAKQTDSRMPDYAYGGGGVRNSGNYGYNVTILVPMTPNYDIGVHIDGNSNQPLAGGGFVFRRNF